MEITTISETKTTAKTPAKLSLKSGFEAPSGLQKIRILVTWGVPGAPLHSDHHFVTVFFDLGRSFGRQEPLKTAPGTPRITKMTPKASQTGAQSGLKNEVV